MPLFVRLADTFFYWLGSNRRDGWLEKQVVVCQLLCVQKDSPRQTMHPTGWLS